MSQTLLFIIGAIVFAITIFGSVMIGGVAFSRASGDETALVPLTGPARHGGR